MEQKEIIDFTIAQGASQATWDAFLSDLDDRRGAYLFYGQADS
jgi:transposase-like protein